MKLLQPCRMGALDLPNRVVMGPMTRSRAPGRIPTDLMATYYRQRAGAGLVVTEATQVSPMGVGYAATPGIHSPEQVKGWKRVTEAVHDAGGRIFLQLWHVGRISHPSYLGGARPVAPSAVRPEGTVRTPEGSEPYVTPRPLETREVEGVVEEYRLGARNARRAGFDGVEIHGANGYLPDQFLRSGTNRRSDRYGGSVRNRARFLLEVTRAAVDVWGPGRVGVRLSPGSGFNDMSDDHPAKTFTHAARRLGRLELAYLHVINEPDGVTLTRGNGRPIGAVELLREAWNGTLIAAGEYDRKSAEDAVRAGRADLVAFARLYLANPDLPGRFREGAPLNEPDRSTFYGGEAEGYTDYPTLEDRRRRAS